MSDELRLHFERSDAPLGSPQAIKLGLIVASAIAVLASSVRLLFGDQLLGRMAVLIAGISAIVVLMLSYARLLLANGGLFLHDGRAGIVGALGGRKGATDPADRFSASMVPTHSPPKGLRSSAADRASHWKDHGTSPLIQESW